MEVDMKIRNFAILMMLFLFISSVYCQEELPQYPELNPESLCYIDYEIYYESDDKDYIIVIIQGKYYIVHNGYE
jgi:hypothetical protein